MRNYWNWLEVCGDDCQNIRERERENLKITLKVHGMEANANFLSCDLVQQIIK